jgi:triacylglycerol lipase
MRLEELLNDKGKAAVKDIESMCVWQFASKYPFVKVADLTSVPDPLNVPRVLKVLEANTLGRGTPSAPVYIYESTNDQFMPLDDVRGLVATYCRRGLPVQYVEDQYSEHLFLAGSGAYGALTWLEGRFAGVEPPSNCS